MLLPLQEGAARKDNEKARAILFEVLKTPSLQDATLAELAKEMVWWVDAVQAMHEEATYAMREVLPHMDSKATVNELASELLNQYDEMRDFLEEALSEQGQDLSVGLLVKCLAGKYTQACEDHGDTSGIGGTK